MKLEVAIIERKEQLDDLIPFRVENALWGTEKFPPMYGYIGFIPQDAFYLKLICEEKNPQLYYRAQLLQINYMFIYNLSENLLFFNPSYSNSTHICYKIILGYYDTILKTINQFIDAVVAFDINGILTQCKV